MLDNNKKLQAIAEISLLSNKWAMWVDTCLPDRKTFVPAVYQTRDAYYHLIRAVSYGLVENGALESNNLSTIGDFWANNPDVSKQLTEVQHHASRAFFDTVDFAFHSLQKIHRPASNFRSSILLDNSLEKHIQAIHRLRELKSETEEEIIETVRKWDFVLTSMVSAYTLVEEYAMLDRTLNEVHKLLVDVEVHNDPETLETVQEDFNQLKHRVVRISSEMSLSAQISAVQGIVDQISGDAHFKLTSEEIDFAECIFSDAHKLCSEREQELSDIANSLRTLGATIYSAQQLRNTRSTIGKLGQITGVTAELIITAFPTYLVDNFLFAKSASEAPAVEIDFFSQVDSRVLSVLFIYLVMLFLVHQIGKLVLMGWTRWRIYRRYRKLTKELNKSPHIWKRWEELKQKSAPKLEAPKFEPQKIEDPKAESHKGDAQA